MGVSWGYCDGVNDLLEGDIYFHINHTFKLQLVLCSLGKQMVTQLIGARTEIAFSMGEH